MEIYVSTYRALDYDLAAAITDFTAALTEFSKTTGVPAPTAPTLVEQIVRVYDGQFVIVPNPPPHVPQLLPKDPKLYRSASEQEEIGKAIEKEILDAGGVP
jgi:hypothetical protein